MSRILITSYCNINQVVNGRSRRMKALLQTFENEQILCEPAPEHDNFKSKTYKYDFGKKKVGINWGIFNFFFPPTKSFVKKLVSTEKPKVIIMTSIWDFHPIRKNPIPKILDAHNVDATAIEERFGQNHFFSKLVAKAEKAAINGSEHICCCSEDDKEEFVKKYDISPNKISVVPNGVDLDEFANMNMNIPESWQKKLEDYKILLFMGKLDYQPNKEAVKFINEVVAPELEKAHPETFKIVICGGPIPSNAESFHKLIHFTGRVEEVVPWMKRADVCISPIFSGSGTRLKIIEYFSSNTPVVSTAKGAEGLGVTHNKDIVIAEKNNFADEIIDLCKNKEKNKSIAENAFSLVKNKFDWKVIRPLWRKALEKIN
jgi:glycosyltransferase involved in cell wall biosynthesis